MQRAFIRQIIHQYRWLAGIIQTVLDIREGQNPLGLGHIERAVPEGDPVGDLQILGDKQFEPRVPAFCQPFTSATVRFFYPNQGRDAEEWIHEGVE